MHSNSKVNNIDPDTWIKHFKDLMGSVKSHPNKDFEDHINSSISNSGPSIFNELNFRITLNEIQDAATALKRGKTSGPDRIRAEMVKALFQKFPSVIYKLFNNILTSGNFPSPWQYSILVPIHKKGNIHEAENYRGIAISSCLSKLFTNVLHNRLSQFAADNDLIPSNQIGFRKGFRTSDHILTLKTLIDKYIHTLPRKYLYVCFVDFKAAFDTIWRGALLYKLHQHGVGGNLMKVIQSMYSQVYYQVKCNNGLSSPFLSLVGVKQGCVLSPLMFNMFLSDLCDIFDDPCKPVSLHDVKLNCLLYADDLAILSEDHLGLQTCLNRLADYCTKWQLNINVKKTKVIIFNKGGLNISKYTFTFKGNTIEIVDKYCYLGVVFNRSGSFKDAIMNLRGKCLKAYFSLYQKMYNCHIPLSLKLFNSLVKPIGLYASEICTVDMWKTLSEDNLYSLCEKFDVEKVHIKFLKSALGVHRKACNSAVRGELGSLPLLLHSVKPIIKYLYRLKRLPADCLAYKSFLECKTLAGNNKPSWLSHMGNIFTTTNHSNDFSKFMRDEYYSPGHLLKSIPHELNRLYVEKWSGVISPEQPLSVTTSSSKLRTYARFKSQFCQEDYLIVQKSKRIRSDFSRLRVSAHRLMIESGRYNKPNKIPVDKRFCIVCKDGSVEDEIHFVCHCVVYNEKRSILFNTISDIFPKFTDMENDQKFVSIMTCFDGDSEAILLITNFISDCFEKRGSLLFST